MSTFSSTLPCTFLRDHGRYFVTNTLIKGVVTTDSPSLNNTPITAGHSLSKIKTNECFIFETGIKHQTNVHLQMICVL